MTAQLNRQPIFDAVREMLGRGFTHDEVKRLDRAIDAAVGPASTHRTIGPAGIALIREFEGCARRLPDGRIQAYPDPGTGGAPWTIGWGSTSDDMGNPITPGTVWTQERADSRFKAHLAKFEQGVHKALNGAATTQSQFDALVSLAYNIGVQALGESTLMRLHKAGDHKGAAEQFARWVNAGGRRMAGLVRRREAERQLYEGR